jgi:hypothetical protein
MIWTYLKIVWRPHGPVTLIHIHPTLHLLNPVEMYPNMVISTGKETEMMKKHGIRYLVVSTIFSNKPEILTF